MSLTGYLSYGWTTSTLGWLWPVSETSWVSQIITLIGEDRSEVILKDGLIGMRACVPVVLEDGKPPVSG